jgi:hypothetical protein
MCSKFRPVEEFVLSPTLGFCHACYHTRSTAYERFCATGEAPAFCFECDRSYADLAALDPSGNVPMAIHHKDGIIQFLCIPCSDAYERKRSDMYAGTPHGQKIFSLN